MSIEFTSYGELEKDYQHRVAVIGSRSFNDYKDLESKLDSLHKKRPIDLIISGGARGADTLRMRIIYL